jgi:hypothetical protein
MAENMNDTGTEAKPKDHNRTPEYIAEQAKGLLVAMAPHEKAKREAQEAITALRRTFKRDTGVTNKEFDLARHYGEMQDEGEMQEKLGHFQMLYNALATGQQMNMFGAEE